MYNHGMKKFILIDGAGLIYRAFFAIPPHLSDAEGRPTNALYGFASMLLNILSLHRPDYIAVVFDRKEKTFRHEAYTEYKATRAPAPDTLHEQIPRVKELLEKFHIQQFEKAGFEADDIIATIASKTGGDVRVMIATADFDMFQLINPNIEILYPEKGYREGRFFTTDEVIKKYGLRPEQIPDFKALCGDPSDNIKGVDGIGKKTATDLLQKYDTLDAIYQNTDALSPSLKTKLLAGKESAYFCKDLATLRHNVPTDFTIEDCRLQDFDMTELLNLFNTLGFNSLQGRLKKIGVNHVEAGKETATQSALF